MSQASYTAIHLKEGDKWLMASVRERATPSLSKRPDFEHLEWLIGDWTAAKDSRTLDFSFKWIAEKKFIELLVQRSGQGCSRQVGHTDYRPRSFVRPSDLVELRFHRRLWPRAMEAPEKRGRHRISRHYAGRRSQRIERHCFENRWRQLFLAVRQSNRSRTKIERSGTSGTETKAPIRKKH